MHIQPTPGTPAAEVSKRALHKKLTYRFDSRTGIVLPPHRVHRGVRLLRKTRRDSLQSEEANEAHHLRRLLTAFALLCRPGRLAARDPASDRARQERRYCRRASRTAQNRVRLEKGRMFVAEWTERQVNREPCAGTGPDCRILPAKYHLVSKILCVHHLLSWGKSLSSRISTNA